MDSNQELYFQESVEGVKLIVVDDDIEIPMVSVAKENRKWNLVLLKVQAKLCVQVGDIGLLMFKISFVDELGEMGHPVLITGNLFNSLITHKLVKNKYVYDATIVAG